MNTSEKKRVLISLIVSAVLLVIGVICAVVKLTQGFHIHYLTQIIIYVLVAVYTYYAYKIPHGNILRYLMLLFALSLIFEIGIFDTVSATITEILLILISYMAGRLNKLMKNGILSAFVLAAFVAVGICAVARAENADFAVCYSYFSGMIIWLNITWAYFFRCKKHAAAGAEK